MRCPANQAIAYERSKEQSKKDWAKYNAEVQQYQRDLAEWQEKTRAVEAAQVAPVTEGQIYGYPQMGAPMMAYPQMGAPMMGAPMMGAQPNMMPF